MSVVKKGALQFHTFGVRKRCVPRKQFADSREVELACPFCGPPEGLAYGSVSLRGFPQKTVAMDDRVAFVRREIIAVLRGSAHAYIIADAA